MGQLSWSPLPTCRLSRPAKLDSHGHVLAQHKAVRDEKWVRGGDMNTLTWSVGCVLFHVICHVCRAWRLFETEANWLSQDPGLGDGG